MLLADDVRIIGYVWLVDYRMIYYMGTWNYVFVFCWYGFGVWDPPMEFNGLLQLRNA